MGLLENYIRICSKFYAMSFGCTELNMEPNFVPLKAFTSDVSVQHKIHVTLIQSHKRGVIILWHLRYFLCSNHQSMIMAEIRYIFSRAHQSKWRVMCNYWSKQTPSNFHQLSAVVRLGPHLRRRFMASVQPFLGVMILVERERHYNEITCHSSVQYLNHQVDSNFPCVIC